MFTYAQNFEDVILERCFKDKKDGFYIDVGANDPLIHSVTHHFYQKGWSGINVEPMEKYYQKLKEVRIRDINVNCLIGAKNEEVDFFEVESTGLSTANSDNANRLNGSGRDVAVKKKTSYTLDTIIKDYGIKKIDFLKIDVEGYEREVIEGFSFTVRPKIIVVEVNIPESTALQNELTWEMKILAQDYVKVYYDGLNNFYLAEENSDLINCFKLPPNIFDLRTTMIEEYLNWDKRYNELKIELETQKIELETQINDIYSSKSWKLTSFLRKIQSWMNKRG